jgi:arylsulfatase A-like enzyme
MLLALLSLACAPAPLSPPQAGGNVLVILADDLGADMVPAFGVDPKVPLARMPNLVALARRGIYFQTAWANPKCSPSRASLLTGEASHRTGIGNVIEGGTLSLPALELTLPEMLAQYAPFPYESGYFGKWHLERKNSPELCPALAHGFDHFEGTLFAVSSAAGLCSWRERNCSPGVSSSPLRTNYILSETLASAAAWIGDRTTPWLCIAAPQLPYELAHVPPLELQSLKSGTPCTPCLDLDKNCHYAALQAFDHELGVLLASLGPNWESGTTVVLLGDNGTPEWANTYWPPKHSKLTLFEGGLRVPLIVAGRALAPERRGTISSALVSVCDVFRSVAGWAGVPALPNDVARDSYDLAPLLAATSGTNGRSELWSELFSPNAAQPPYANHRAAVREARFKLIYDWTNQKPLRLHDLQTDPRELTNLLAPIPPPSGTAAGDALVRLTNRVRRHLQP